MPVLKDLRCERFAQAVAIDDNNAASTARTTGQQGTEAPGITIAEVTIENMLREFEQARLLALNKGQASAAVTATMAKARLAGLFTARPESKPESHWKFDGNYNEAVRRIALLLRLAADETSSGQQS
jgi:hypothetical protein